LSSACCTPSPETSRVDDAGLGPLDVVVCGLDQLEKNVLDVFTDVASFGQRGCVGDGERHVETFGEGLREVGFAAAGWSDEQDVRLRHLNVIDEGVGGANRAAGPDALVVVIHSNGKGALGGVLTDHVFLEEFVDLTRLGQVKFAGCFFASLGETLFDDLVAELDAFVADVYAGSGDQLLNLLLALSAERTLEQIGAFPNTGHGRSPSSQGAVF
jgi:hypothetical protein